MPLGDTIESLIINVIYPEKIVVTYSRSVEEVSAH